RSTRSTSAPAMRAATASPAAPAPAPRSATRIGPSPATSAASSIASMPERWPIPFGCTRWNRPRWKASTVSTMVPSTVIANPLRRSAGGRSRPQLRADPGVLEDAPRFRLAVAFDEKAARQHAERAFENAHRLVGDEIMDARLFHQALREREKDGVIGADQF